MKKSDFHKLHVTYTFLYPILIPIHRATSAIKIFL
nr:MAG TPA: hypothetical protein [Caudoviricetes sp.]